MKLYKIAHIYEHNEAHRYYGQINWQTYRTEHKALPINPLKKRKGHAFVSADYAPQNPYTEEDLFWPEGFYALEDLLTTGGNRVECGLIDEGIAMFRVTPAAPQYHQAYPCYAEIAAQLPNDHHYFTKFADVDFRLVTESFVQRVEDQQLKGFRFALRWDGERSYPLIPWSK